MPPKKAKRPKRRAPTKKGLKQKQKQQQRVNVNVSSGGGGGSGGFIPIPQAPSIDYALLSNLLRPANTVDVPIRAQAPTTESIATREAETQTLEELRRPTRPAPKTPEPPAPIPSFFSDTETEDVPIKIPKARKVRKDAGTTRSKIVQGSEFERMIEAQKTGSFL